MEPSSELSSLLPPEPERPQDSDCCGTGCVPCVFDIFDQEVVLWKAECDRIQYGDSSIQAHQTEVLSADKYTELEIKEVIRESPDSNLYRFYLPGNARLPLSIGQHLVLRWQSSSGVVTRQYTPVSDPKHRGSFDVVIKVYEQGVMSQHIKQWQVGHKVEWRGPLGHLQYKPNQYKRLVLLAAGTGIAPMIQVIRHVLDNEDDETRLHLVYTCRTSHDLLCKAQLDEWAQYWNFTVVYYLTQQGDSPTSRLRYSDQVVYERLSETHVHKEIGDLCPNTLILISGTRSFDKDIVNYVRRIGYSDKHYHKF